MNKHTIGTEWITTEQAAELSGYSQAYMRQLASRGTVASIKAGRDWLIRRQDVLEHRRQMEALGPAKHAPTRKDNDA